MEVRKDVHDRFNEKVDAQNARMAWGVPQVTSWYKNEKGRVSQNWPFPLIDYWNATLAPNPTDFILRKKRMAAVAAAE
jgi:4-hydroxyacetophenone monooxygenase